MGYTITDLADWCRNGLLPKEGESLSDALLRLNNTKKMRAIYMHHVGAGCSYHRILLPMENLHRRVAAIIALTNPSKVQLSQADVVIFNRIPTVSIDSLLADREKLGFKIITDIDDHWILYPHHSMAASWKKSGAHEQIQTCVREADMVFTTNERLKNAALALNKNSHVVPNAIEFGHGQFGLRNTNVLDQCGGKELGTVEFVYAGGSSHLHDLATIKPTMKRLGSDGQFRANGIINLAGYRSAGVSAFASIWDDMLKIVKLSGSWRITREYPLNQYMTCYATANVALAPLEKTEFNACKSNLKTLEAGCLGIPIIASNTEPYTQDKECPGVILCDTPKDWYDAIKRLMNNRKLVQELGFLLAKYVREKYSLNLINDRRHSLMIDASYISRSRDEGEKS